MTDALDDDILDDLFHGCALAAYLDEAAQGNIWPPDREATRQRAFRYYEQALAEKDGRRRTDPATSAAAFGTQAG